MTIKGMVFVLLGMAEVARTVRVAQEVLSTSVTIGRRTASRVKRIIDAQHTERMEGNSSAKGTPCTDAKRCQ